jgi:hypothetical protein
MGPRGSFRGCDGCHHCTAFSNPSSPSSITIMASHKGALPDIFGAHKSDNVGVDDNHTTFESMHVDMPIGLVNGTVQQSRLVSQKNHLPIMLTIISDNLLILWRWM